jgi:hypothetical protein
MEEEADEAGASNIKSEEKMIRFGLKESNLAIVLR